MKPSGDEDGLKALPTSLALPTLMITWRKKMRTTVMDTSASTSWARVDSATPK